MIKELKLEKMDRSEMREVDGGGGGDPQGGKCDGCHNCGTKGNDTSMNTFITE
jgi:hypothetical protein